MRIHCFQHMAAEGPGRVADWAIARGYTLTSTQWFAPAPALPRPAEVDLLVVLGGAMSVHDEAAFPWLLTEKDCLQAAIAAGTPVLGICLGSQLLAQILGAEVTPNPQPEVGFFLVQLTDGIRQQPGFRHVSGAFTALHWHFDAFTLPPGAVAVGSSAATRCQGFALGNRLVGLQFHPEATKELLNALVQAEGSTLPTGPYVQAPADMYAQLPLLDQGVDFLFPLLDALLAQ